MTSIPRRVLLPAAALLALALTSVSCASQPDASDATAAASRADAPSIVVTTSILGDIVSELAGEDAHVTTLMPAGVDPHGYEPSARDGEALREADLVIANGLGLEASLLDVLDAVESEGGAVLRLAERLDPIPFGVDEEADRDDGEHGGVLASEDGHDHDGHDPHVWFDPLRMARGAEIIAAAIAGADTSIDDEEWTRRGSEYAERLHEVHADLEEAFAEVPAARRRIVTNHDSLGYLAERYDLEVVATVIPGASTQAHTDPARFAELIELVGTESISVVFADNTDSTMLAEQLGAELGRADLELEVVRLYTDALGGEGSGAETYPQLLRTTAELIVGALTNGSG